VGVDAQATTHYPEASARLGEGAAPSTGDFQYRSKSLSGKKRPP
jgi:hypothetical protein